MVLLIIMDIIAGIILLLGFINNMLDGKKLYGETFALIIYAAISILIFCEPEIKKYSDLSGSEKGMLILTCIVFVFMAIVFAAKFIPEIYKKLKRK